MTYTDLSIRLQPFRIGEEHIRRRIIGLRPFRDGGSRLEAEAFEGKHVIHCYGHGGSGWTLAPGCGRRVSEILGEQLDGTWSHLRGQDITVVGAGVIGLFSAYYLSQREDLGRITVIAENVDDLTSHNAGGLFDPFVIGGAPDHRLLAESYEFYHALARDEGRDPDFGPSDVELLSMFSNEQTMMPSLVAQGYIPDGLPCSVLVNAHAHRHYVHLIYFLDVGLIMKHLQNSIARRGVHIMRGIRLDTLGQIDSDLVVNCAGLGAASLARDATLRPVTGHLIRLRGQPRALLDLDHNLHVLNTQREDIVSCLIGLDQPAHWDELSRAMETSLNGADNTLRPRLSTFKDPLGSISDFRNIIGELTQRVTKNPSEPDPDIEGLKRIRLFETQAERNRFIDGLSLLLRVSQLAGANSVGTSMSTVYAAALPRYAKRYVMLLEEAFPPELTSEDTGDGLSYFMPVLDEAVHQEPDSHFHYRSDSILDGLGNVGCCGGTSIDRSEISLAEHEREFANVLGRLRHFGFE